MISHDSDRIPDNVVDACLYTFAVKDEFYRVGNFRKPILYNFFNSVTLFQIIYIPYTM